MRKISVYIILCMLLSIPVFADTLEGKNTSSLDEIWDDCVDFSRVVEYSAEGLAVIVSTEEERSAFEEDFTFFQRTTTKAEWVTYELPKDKYLSVQTYFWQGEAIKHFSFAWSADGSEWRRANPTIITKPAGSDKWLPVCYDLKKLPESAKYLKIRFPEGNSVSWSPLVASVAAKTISAGDGSFADTVNTPYHEVVTVMKHLGLVDGVNQSTFQPDTLVNRREFCSLIVRLLNMESLQTAEEKTIFLDVAPDDWGRAAIETLYRLGVVNGTSDNMFSPDEEITFSQAMKIIVSILGYIPDAELEGGYPTGYLSVAKKLRLTESIPNTAQPLRRGEAALYLYRAAGTNCMERITYGYEERYDKKSQTLLEKYHSIQKLEAVVTEAGSASLTGNGFLDEKYFIAGGVQYECGRMDMAEFLGQRTIFYVQHTDDDDIPVVLYAFSDSEDYIEITYPQFEEIDGNKIIYEQDGKEKKASVRTDARIIYNGRYFSRLGFEKLPFQSGTLRLIDSDRDGIMDILSITDYQTCVLTSDAKLNTVLTDKYFGAVNLGLDTAQYVRIVRYGEWMEYNPDISLRAGDVVQIARSRDGIRAEVIVLNDYAAGKIETYSKQSNTCRIEGVPYELSSYFLESGQAVELGAEEAFASLDSNGSIVAITYAASEDYAYLQSVSLNGVFNTEGKIRVIRESGKAEIVPLTIKTKLNDEKISSERFVEEIGNLEPQLIRLRVYADGSAANIQTAVHNDSKEPMERSFSRDYQTDGSIYRAGNLMLFDSVYQLTNATKVFFVPKEPAKIEDYRVGNAGILNADGRYKADLFDLSNQYQASAAVIYQNGSTERNVEPYDFVMVIKECSTYLNDKGECAYRLSGWVGGEITDLLFRAEGALDQTSNWLPYSTDKATMIGGGTPFGAGDVIQFVKDYNGYCDKFRLLFDASQYTEEFFYESNVQDYGKLSQTNYYSELYSGYGQIERLFSGKLLYCAQQDKRWLRTIMTGGTKVYLFDSKRQTVQPGELTDLEIGAHIFVRMNFTNCNEIVIVR